MVQEVSGDENSIVSPKLSLKLWWQFWPKQSLNVLDTSIESIITFLTDQFNNDSSYGNINSHHPALSLILRNNVGSDGRIKSLLRGIYKHKPCRPNYTTTWNPQVAHFLVTNKTMRLERSTKNGTVLFALCTAHSVETLSLIKIDFF